MDESEHKTVFHGQDICSKENNLKFEAITWTLSAYTNE